jgi:probable 2-oxoglutarate dehydrogenase E1 component DHKTD1
MYSTTPYFKHVTNSISDTESQLENRYINAPLLRYVDSMRTHGHRAARIDPLDLIQREEVAALDPKRYGLTDDSKKYNVNGIIWTKPVGSASGAKEEWWTLGKIARHLRSVYVGPIAHEVCSIPSLSSVDVFLTYCFIDKYMHSPSKTERLWFSHLLESETLPSQGHDNNPGPFSAINKEMKRRIHGLLARSEVLDNFLQLKFPNLKRVGASSFSHICLKAYIPA